MNSWAYLCDGGKRAIAVWHRRAGKDEVAMHHTATRQCCASATIGIAFQNTSRAARRYGPNQPAQRQASHRRGIPAGGAHEHRRAGHVLAAQQRLDVVGDRQRPLQHVTGRHHRCRRGVQRIRARQPIAWAYTRPVLEENDGWAIFITTPRGRNHAFDMYKHA